MMRKPIPGYEGIYWITTQGDVISSHGLGRVMKPHLKKCGYSYVALRNGGASKPSYKRIHRLVAEAFIPNPDAKLEVNHIDGVKTNNSIENLEWVTRCENIQHAHAIGLMPQGENHHNSKLSCDQVVSIYLEDLSYKKLSIKHGVCAQTLCNIKKGRIYRAVTASL